MLFTKKKEENSTIDTQIPAGWEDPLAKLRKKWGTVPSGNDGRKDSTGLLDLTDEEVLSNWERAHSHDTTDLGFGIRGWYHEMYRSFVSGKRILDVGCGMGISTIFFAESGANVTFVDIIEENVNLVERLCKIKGIKAQFLFISSFEDFDKLDNDYDVVTAIGSLINAPASVTKQEIGKIVPHLKDGGRWLHFGYPRSRWEREGAPDFSKWGEKTDGPGTPWVEYHDTEKMRWFFEPNEVEILFECEWHNSDFNWFDLRIKK